MIDLLKSKIKRYMKEYDLEFVKDYILKYHNKEINNKVIGGNLLLNNSFIFDEKWDMEPCVIPCVNKDLNWEFTPNGDEEWIFMLNRHDYLEKLIISYYVNEDERYLLKIKELIFNWIDKNKLGINKKTTRTIDTGIRCLSWIKCIIHLINIDYLSDFEILKIIESIKQQIDYLKNNYTTKYVLSNWGILQTTSIVVCCLWLDDFIDNKNIFNWALNELYKSIDIQIFDDGVHWEQSIMYHIEVLNSVITSIYYLKYFNIQLKSDFLRKIKLMSEYLIYCSDEKFFQVSQGDSDETDVRDVLVRASMLFNEGTFKFRAYEKADLKSSFLFGKNLILMYNSMNIVKPKYLNKSFEDSGSIYLRSGWNETDSFTYIKNGTLGSSHGHSDLCHFSLNYGGKKFLVDSGRYTYVEEDFLREYLKSVNAHNVTKIDDCPFGIPNKSWDYNAYANTIKNYFREVDNISYVECGYFYNINDLIPCLVMRKFLVISPNIWIIVNHIKCSGEHLCTNYYNFDSLVKVYDEGNFVKCNNRGVKIKIYNNNVQEKYLKNTLISKNYNMINNSKKLITKTYFKNELVTYDIILGEAFKNIKISDANIVQYNSNKKISEKQIISKKFTLSEEESYSVFIFNNETFKGSKVYTYGEFELYGKVVVVHEFKGDNKIYRLKF